MLGDISGYMCWVTFSYMLDYVWLNMKMCYPIYRETREMHPTYTFNIYIQHICGYIWRVGYMCWVTHSYMLDYITQYMLGNMGVCRWGTWPEESERAPPFGSKTLTLTGLGRLGSSPVTWPRRGRCPSEYHKSRSPVGSSHEQNRAEGDRTPHPVGRIPQANIPLHHQSREWWPRWICPVQT